MDIADREKRYVVGRVSEVPDGHRIIVEVAGRSIGVFNVGGEFYAVLNRCPHRGAPLCKGDVIGAVDSAGPGDFRLDETRRFLACPWHGWEYDLATGQSWHALGRMRARAFPVSVEGGADVADGLATGAAQTSTVTGFVDPTTHRIKGPYKADVIPVAVEDEYIVISLRRILDRAKGAEHAA